MAQSLYQQLVAKQRGLERERTGETGPGSAEQLARIIESLDRFPYLFERIELAKETLARRRVLRYRSLPQQSFPDR